MYAASFAFRRAAKAEQRRPSVASRLRTADGEVQLAGQHPAVLGADGTFVVAVGGDGQHDSHVSVRVRLHAPAHQRWSRTKRRWPELFSEAEEIGARIRGGLVFAKAPYLHSLRMPLALDEAEMGTDGHLDGFSNECEGHCGVQRAVSAF